MPTGLKWKGNGIRVRPKVVKDDKNDGTWRQVRVTADNLPQTLAVSVRRLQTIESGRTSVDLLLSFNARVHYHQQNWESGVRVYDGTADARLRVKLAMTCEATSRLENRGKGLPELVFRLQVTKADLRYDDLLVDHIAGIGGDGAKLVGKVLEKVIHELRPSLERKLLERANAAIVKAADTKEIRLGLGSFINMDGINSPRPR